MWKHVLFFGIILTNFRESLCKHAEVSTLGFNRIIGGNEAERGQFPAAVSFRWIDDDHFCGGNIVSKYFVLTAAHCVQMFMDWSYSGGSSSYPFEIIAGEIEQVQSYKAKQLVQPIKIFIHPGWNDQYQNDIAIVKVRPGFKFIDRFVRPIALIHDKVLKNTPCKVYGWGFTQRSKQSNSQSAKLLFTEVFVIGKNDCLKFSNGKNTKILGHPGLICGGDLKGETGTCFGDSGSGFVCYGRLAGIVSFGVDGCASDPHGLSGFADIKYYSSWIRFIMDKEQDDPKNQSSLAGINSLSSLFFIFIFVCNTLHEFLNVNNHMSLQ